MSLPTSIQQVLDNQDIQYNIEEVASGNSTYTENIVAQSLILQDGQGRAQIVFPAGKLIDLDSLFRSFGRNFEGLSNADIRPLIEKADLSCVPALPGWNGLPTYVDESLMHAEKLWLESGRDQRFLTMENQDFRSMCENVTLGDFAVDVSPTPLDASNDENRIVDSVKRFTQLRIQQRLEETLELPPLPETAQKIIKLRADPDADISDLTNIVEIDPSLAAQVVSWAASPYYSAPGKIKSVHDAIVRVLGFDMVLNLALGLALGKTLSAAKMTAEQTHEYWRNSVYTAAAVEGIVTSIQRPHRPSFGMAYLSGLLHNFGFLIVAEVFPPYFNNINRLGRVNSHLPNEAAEQHLLGVSSNQISAWLMKNWNMPDEIVAALRYQTTPEYDGEFANYAKLNYVAKNLLASKGFGCGQAAKIPAAVFRELHLDVETANVAIDNILESGDDLDAIADQLRG